MAIDPPKSAMDAVLDRIFGFNGDGVLSVRNLCYTAFSAAKGENNEDGGPTDWMNDTMPTVEKGIAELRALLVQELVGAGLVLNETARGETQGALPAARETQVPSKQASIMNGARAYSDVRWHILRVAFEEAQYRPGDHPVVPVRMADFMKRVGILLSDQSPVGDEEAWPVRRGSSDRPFEVLLPDGSWMPVTAVTQEHARRLAGSEWHGKGHLSRPGSRMKSPVTHRCDGRHSPDGASCAADDTVACVGLRRSDGTLEQTCGEPCSWIMGKAGHGTPPWTSADGMRFDPSTPDAEDTH